mgnify:CR=1 FL=1
MRKIDKIEGDPLEVKIEELSEALVEARRNPRISAWSPTASAVFRYLRKTVPEFSISSEVRVLLEDAVRKKYPLLWERIAALPL